MSSLAKLMIMNGKTVSGSDLVYGKELVELNEWGAEVWAGHEPEKISQAELVVYSSAVPENDLEIEKARELNIPCVPRHVFLGELSKEFERVIAVSGTHGKTTTTAMLANVFLCADECFTAHIGGNLPGSGNMIYKGYRYLITEACEYKKSFLSIKPAVAVVLNVEYDHPDTYATLEELYRAFDAFGSSAKECVVINRDCEYYNMHKCADVQELTFGIDGGDYSVSDIFAYENGCFSFNVLKNGAKEAEIKLSVAGYHNIYNALAAYTAARFINLPLPIIVSGLNTFKGVERRFERRGSINGAAVYSDYAHHPSEITASLTTAKSLTKKRVIAVFQPHTYSRTSELLDGFVKSLTAADAVIIYKEYASREKPEDGLSARDLYNALQGKCQELYYYDSFLQLAKAVGRIAKEGDVVTVLGAGDVVLLCDIL